MNFNCMLADMKSFEEQIEHLRSAMAYQNSKKPMLRIICLCLGVGLFDLSPAHAQAFDCTGYQDFYTALPEIKRDNSAELIADLYIQEFAIPKLDRDQQEIFRTMNADNLEMSEAVENHIARYYQDRDEEFASKLREDAALYLSALAHAQELLVLYEAVPITTEFVEKELRKAIFKRRSARPMLEDLIIDFRSRVQAYEDQGVATSYAATSAYLDMIRHLSVLSGDLRADAPEPDPDCWAQRLFSTETGFRHEAIRLLPQSKSRPNAVVKRLEDASARTKQLSSLMMYTQFFYGAPYTFMLRRDLVERIAQR